ncbi:MAG TPA: flagellar basal-body MS-ring/collar protein FliF [Acidimicrobiales bacterium]
MPDALKQLWSRASSQFRAFTPAQRAGIIGAAVAVIVLVFLFSRWSGKTDMAALYTDLEAADAAEITERLSSKGVKYELADQGRTVMVPRDQLYDLRLELSADGIPSGGSGGWSILDDQGITTSEFSQQVGYQRALEGELARTVASLDAVQSATVHLVLPERDAFVLNETKASASVLVRTRAGKSLTSSQVQAIVNLVSSSVRGLEPDAVTVADTAGNVLNAPGRDGFGGISGEGGTRMEQTAAFESELANEIEAMLASVVGTGKAVVTVNADLDFDKSTATSETFSSPNPDGTALPQQQSERTEDYQGVVPGDAGVLGPTTETLEGTAGDASYTLNERTSENAVNRVVETTERAPGAIKRLSVAVLVDEGVLDAGRVAEIEQLVTAAAGVNPERGDQLVVSTLPFDTSLAEKAESELAALEAQKKREERMRLYTTIGAVVVVLAILAFAYRALTKSRRRRDEEPVDLREEEEAIEPPTEVSVFEDGEDYELIEEPAVPELPAPPLTEEEVLAAQLSSKVASIVEQQPEEVALLLRTWLGDRRTVKR